MLLTDTVSCSRVLLLFPPARRRNLNYWDTVSTLAGEVRNPSRTFPRALALAVVLVVTSYLLPLLVGLGVAPDATDWTLGYFAAVGQQVLLCSAEAAPRDRRGCLGRPARKKSDGGAPACRWPASGWPGGSWPPRR